VNKRRRRGAKARRREARIWEQRPSRHRGNGGRLWYANVGKPARGRGRWTSWLQRRYGPEAHAYRFERLSSEPSRGTITVDVPEWGGAVRLRSLSGDEVEAFLASEPPRGTLTGVAPDFIIIDDPLEPKEDL
jgi:hypothetical protein